MKENNNPVSEKLTEVLGITQESLTALGDEIQLSWGEDAFRTRSSGTITNLSTSVAITVRIWLTGYSEGYADISLPASKTIRLKRARIYKVEIPNNVANNGLTPNVYVVLFSYKGGSGTDTPEIELV